MTNAPSASRIKEIGRILLFLSLGVAVVWIFWIRMDAEDKMAFGRALKEASYGWIILSFGMGLLSHYIRAWRWRELLEVFSFKPKMYNLFFAVMNMYFFNMLVPRLGEITRCGLLRQYEQVPMEKGLGSVVAERAVDMLMLLGIMGLTALIQWQHFGSIIAQLQAKGGGAADASGPSYTKYFILGFFLLLFVVGFLLRKHPKVQPLLGKIKNLALGFWEGLRAVTKLRRPGLFILQTLLIWGLYYGMSWVCFLSMPQVPAPWLSPLTIMAAGSIAIIVVPGGIGAFPVIVAAVLGLPHLGGVPDGEGLALGWIIWGAQTSVVLIAGALSLALVPLFNRKK